VFLTNNFLLPADTIAALYKARWEIELFFKWIKQNLKVKSFYGTFPNAVRTPILNPAYSTGVFLKTDPTLSRAASGEQLHPLPNGDQ
jgi:hypothetical protein